MECYLLDSGTHNIYLWYGLESTYQNRCLCLRVCHTYINELYKLNTNNNHDENNVEEMISIKNPLLIPNDLLNIVHLESHSETNDFKDYFTYWNHSIDSSENDEYKPICKYFDPNKITLENELDDDLYYSNGLLKEKDIPQTKYSETHVYKYNIMTQQSDINNIKEDFRKIQLKHHHENNIPDINTNTTFLNSTTLSSTSLPSSPFIKSSTTFENKDLINSENSSFANENTKIPEFILQRKRLKSLTMNNTLVSEITSTTSITSTTQTETNDDLIINSNDEVILKGNNDSII